MSIFKDLWNWRGNARKPAPIVIDEDGHEWELARFQRDQRERREAESARLKAMG